MKTYEEIYESLKSKTNAPFTTLEVIRIFKNEGGNWVGTPEQLMQIASISHEITGVRVGECSGCKISAINNLNRWLDNHEANIVKQKNEPIVKQRGRPKQL
jgi:hypothetical protein